MEEILFSISREVSDKNTTIRQPCSSATSSTESTDSNGQKTKRQRDRQRKESKNKVYKRSYWFLPAATGVAADHFCHTRILPSPRLSQA